MARSMQWKKPKNDFLRPYFEKKKKNKNKGRKRF